MFWYLKDPKTYKFIKFSISKILIEKQFFLNCIRVTESRNRQNIKCGAHTTAQKMIHETENLNLNFENYSQISEYDNVKCIALRDVLKIVSDK